jgi:hypothetical protein
MALLPEMKTWARFVEKAEDEYLPSGPPMSPLSGSFFWLWAFYDLRIGNSTDTLAHCQIASNDVILMNPHQLDVTRMIEGSRMVTTRTSRYSGVAEPEPSLTLTERTPSPFTGARRRWTRFTRSS